MAAETVQISTIIVINCVRKLEENLMKSRQQNDQNFPMKAKPWKIKYQSQRK